MYTGAATLRLLTCLSQSCYIRSSKVMSRCHGGTETQFKGENIMTPNMFGGGQLDEDYAPHLYVAGKSIWGEAEEVQVGKWCYRGGYIDANTIVAERWKVGKDGNRQEVPAEKIPEELTKALQPIREKLRGEEDKEVVEEFNEAMAECLPEGLTIGGMRKYLSDPKRKDLKKKLSCLA